MRLSAPMPLTNFKDEKEHFVDIVKREFPWVNTKD